MTFPLISCVVPTHNRDELLIRALRSIEMQDFPNIEVVVVDDLGLDTTRAAVLAWASTTSVPVRYVAFEPSGLGSAGASRNEGAAGATSTYLAFLDDDDQWEPGYMEALLAKMSIGTDMAVAWTSHVQGDRRERGLRMKEGLRTSDVLGGNPGLTGSNFIIRRGAFEELGGFDHKLQVANDLDFLVRFLDKGLTYTVVPAELVSQVGHEHGQLTTPSESRAKGLETYFAKYRDRMSLRNKRKMRRVLHSIRRVSAPTQMQRLGHTLAQAWNSSPTEAFLSFSKLLTGNRSIYAFKAASDDTAQRPEYS